MAPLSVVSMVFTYYFGFYALDPILRYHIKIFFPFKYFILCIVWFGLKWGVYPYKGYVYVTYDQKLNGSHITIPMTCYIPSLGVSS